MSFTVTKYPHGTFSWADISSTDIAKSTKFLEGLFDWTSVAMPTGQPGQEYTMYYKDSLDVAGGGPTMVPNTPSYWSSYITVDNFDEVVAQVQKLGGKVLVPPMDVMDAGRMAVIEDPTGAHVNLWSPNRHIGAKLVNTVGAMIWNELYTKDLEKAKSFYSALLGWTYEIDKNNNDYVTIKNNGRNNGGMYPLTPDMGSMPPNWMVYFTVANLDASLKKVSDLGGQVYMGPKEIPIGKIATVADPTGAAMMIMEMKVTPEAWEE